MVIALSFSWNTKWYMKLCFVMWLRIELLCFSQVNLAPDCRFAAHSSNRMVATIPVNDCRADEMMSSITHLRHSVCYMHVMYYCSTYHVCCVQQLWKRWFCSSNMNFQSWSTSDCFKRMFGLYHWPKVFLVLLHWFWNWICKFWWWDFHSIMTGSSILEMKACSVCFFQKQISSKFKWFR